MTEDEVTGAVFHLDGESSTTRHHLLIALNHLIQTQTRDLEQIFAAELVEEDDFVEPIQELRTMALLHGILDLLAVVLAALLLGVGGKAWRSLALDDVGRAVVAADDEDDIADVHHLVVRQRQDAVDDGVEQEIIDTHVGLVDLVDEDDDQLGLRVAARRHQVFAGEQLAGVEGLVLGRQLRIFFLELLEQLLFRRTTLGRRARLFVASVSRRGTDQSVDLVVVLQQAAVDEDEGAGVAMNVFADALDQLGLADAGFALQSVEASAASGTQTAHGARDDAHTSMAGFFLTDDARVKELEHALFIGGG